MWWFWFLSGLCFSTATAHNSTVAKNPKILSLFSVVQFTNGPCTTTSTTYTSGTCFTSDECSAKGGTSVGNCAAGFGVCCLFTESTCGSSVTQNCTYITNPNYPSTYSTTGTCKYTLNKCQDDICQIRLDFITSVQGVSANTQGCCGSGCTTAADSLTVTGQTGVNPPVICGTNTGEHMYVETGALSSDTVDLSFYTSGTTNDQWNIKVSQIPCTASYRAPNHCVKYFTGTTGTVTSYGFAGDTLLQSQNYQNCIRQEEGYCSIVWDQTTVTAPTDAFDMTNAAIAGNAENTLGSCALSFVKIPQAYIGTAATGTQNEFCGENLGVDASSEASPVTSTNLPFTLGTWTDDAALTVNGGGVANGYSLDYVQQPC